MNRNKDFYVYNLKQAEFLIKGGLVPVKIERHYTTGKVFFQFKRNQLLNDLMDKWNGKR